MGERRRHYMYIAATVILVWIASVWSVRRASGVASNSYWETTANVWIGYGVSCMRWHPLNCFLVGVEVDFVAVPCSYVLLRQSVCVWAKTYEQCKLFNAFCSVLDWQRGNVLCSPIGIKFERVDCACSVRSARSRFVGLDYLRTYTYLETICSDIWSEFLQLIVLAIQSRFCMLSTDSKC